MNRRFHVGVLTHTVAHVLHPLASQAKHQQTAKIYEAKLNQGGNDDFAPHRRY